jgi:daunorubicin resistance ABC transporter membrane protein
MRDPFWLPAASLWRREMVRFFRQPSRIIGSLGTPFLFWLLLASGLGPSFRPMSTDAGSFVYFLPGALVLVLLFTSIFANISVIEDRREGFLQSVLVAPVPRIAIVAGKVLGAATIAVLQGAALVAAAVAGGVDVSGADPGGTLLAVVALAVGISAFGFCFAWQLESIQGFHGVMNLLLMPMWVLSGALFPLEGLPRVLATLVHLNPVTYGLAWIRHSLGESGTDLPAREPAALVSVAFAAAALAAAAFVAGRAPGDGILRRVVRTRGGS